LNVIAVFVTDQDGVHPIERNSPSNQSSGQPASVDATIDEQDEFLSAYEECVP
jgi:hypothetical protein